MISSIDHFPGIGLATSLAVSTVSISSSNAFRFALNA